MPVTALKSTERVIPTVEPIVLLFLYTVMAGVPASCVGTPLESIVVKI